MVIMTLILLGIIALVGLLFLVKSVYRVQQAEVVVIERFGRFYKLLGPGIHVVVPFIDEPRQIRWTYVKEVDSKRHYRYVRHLNRIDLREAVYDFPKQNVITRDNVTMEINAFVYYQITDPRAAVYEVYDLPEAIEKLAQTTLRNVIGEMDLDETLVSRDKINLRLRSILDEAADKWGVKVTRVELQEVAPPHDIRQAMEKQMRAERDRRAVILEAEGLKQSAILRAEGEREARILEARGFADSQVLKATGEAEARLKLTEAEAQSLALLGKTANLDPAAYLIATNYIKMLPSMTEGKSKVVVLPYEATALMGSLTGIKSLLEMGDK